MKYFIVTKQTDSIKEEDYLKRKDFKSSLFDEASNLYLLLLFHFIFMLIPAFLNLVKFKIFSLILKAKLLHLMFINVQILLSALIHQILYN